jgi:hypothetical protein
MEVERLGLNVNHVRLQSRASTSSTRMNGHTANEGALAAMRFGCDPKRPGAAGYRPPRRSHRPG